MQEKLSAQQTEPEFQSWGHYPLLQGELVPLNWTTDFPASIAKASSMLPVGLGRSYGDSCLLDHGTLLDTRGLIRLIDFNRQTGLLR